MPEMNPQPNSGENTDANLEALMADVFKDVPADLEAEFRSMDAKRAEKERINKLESSVIDYLEDKIPDVAALKKMLLSLYVYGVDFPSCENVADALDKMGDDEEYEKQSDEFFIELVRIEKFALLIPQIARSDTRDVKLSRDEVLDEIHKGELLTPEERDALTSAVQLFMES